jgi:formylglycine-generating enzyme required for sulfatase activity
MAVPYENMADLSLKKASPDSVVANCDDGQTFTAPVGSFKPNPFGLYDILGNVAEWVEDCYVGDYNVQIPNAVTTGDCSTRGVRGGSWGNNPRFLRAANRFVHSPDNRISNIGFRLARTITP